MDKWVIAMRANWLRTSTVVVGLCLSQVVVAASGHSVQTLPHDASEAMPESLYQAPNFNKVYVRGMVDLDITAGATNNKVVSEGYGEEGADPVFLKYKGNALYICTQEDCMTPQTTQSCKKRRNYTGPVAHVTVNMNNLRKFEFHGAGRVRVKNLTTDKDFESVIHNCESTKIEGKAIPLTKLDTRGKGHVTISDVRTDKLDVDVDGDGRVDIYASKYPMSLHHLNFDGDGILNMNWIKSEHFHVKGSGHGKVTLAGYGVQNMDVDLEEYAHLDARQLRTERAYVKTRHASRADVWVRQVLQSIAIEDSNILYYREPDSLGLYVPPNGSTLSMQGLQATCQERPVWRVKKD